MCSCTQLNSDTNGDKENLLRMNIDKQKNMRTPQKCISLSEPLSPDANLRMLVSAASGLEPALPKEDNDADGDCCDHVGNRKEKVKKGELLGRKKKSLGLLCKKFMSIYPEYSPLGTTVILDDVVTFLGIGRRRLYDIVNVMESMEMMVRQGKNKYFWYGKSRLPVTLAKLKALSLQVYGADYVLPKDYSIHPGFQSLPMDNQNKYDYSVKDFLPPLHADDQEKKDYSMQPGLQTSLDDQDSADPDPDTNSMVETIISNQYHFDIGSRDRNRSLGILCQKFIMLFMVAEDNTVSLDCAAKLLITDHDEGPEKYKTKFRRLYDIANILTSMNYLKKCVIFGESTKKAPYKWIGVDFKSINCEWGSSKSFLSHESLLTRHSLLAEASSERYKLIRNGAKRRLRKFQVRSSSVDELSTSRKQETTTCSAKQLHLRTLSDTMLNNEQNIDFEKDDGFNIEDIEEEVEINTEITTGEDIKVPTPQKEVADELNGLDLLSKCTSYSPKMAAAVPSRRRPCPNFDKQANGQCSKKVKPNVSEPCQEGTNNLTYQLKLNNIVSPVAACKPALSVPSSLFNNGVLLNSENIPPHNMTIGALQQPTYFTIPATLKLISKPGDSHSTVQNITTLLVSPLTNPLSLPKGGLYKIIPVKCEGLKIPEKTNVPILPRPSFSMVTSPTISSTMPSSLITTMDSPVNSQQLNGSFQEFVTPPPTPPPKSFANPGIFQNMTFEMCASVEAVSHPVLSNVTRKLMALENEDLSVL